MMTKGAGDLAAISPGSASRLRRESARMTADMGMLAVTPHTTPITTAMASALMRLPTMIARTTENATAQQANNRLLVIAALPAGTEYVQNAVHSLPYGYPRTDPFHQAGEFLCRSVRSLKTAHLSPVDQAKVATARQAFSLGARQASSHACIIGRGDPPHQT
jgi:hypothetical protein